MVINMFRKRKNENMAYGVIGLGRFGYALATELAGSGAEMCIRDRPYRDKKVHIVSIAIDAPQDVISALSGKIGKLDGVSVKTAYSNVITHE